MDIAHYQAGEESRGDLRGYGGQPFILWGATLVSGDRIQITIMTTEKFRFSWEIRDKLGFIMMGFGMESLLEALEAIDKSIPDY